MGQVFVYRETINNQHKKRTIEMEYQVITPSDLKPPVFHKLLLSLVIPRPIGLISTISEDGIPNLAPFSFFQAVSSVPPCLLYCPNRNRMGKAKHSLLNAKSTKEFVANTVLESFAEQMNFASGEFHDGVSEFNESGFTPLPSLHVKPFRVAESPVNFECKVLHVLELSDQPLGGSIIVGEIQAIHINKDILDSEKLIADLSKYNVISRLGESAYAPIERTFDMPRPEMTPDGKVVEGSHRIITHNK